VGLFKSKGPSFFDGDGLAEKIGSSGTWLWGFLQACLTAVVPVIFVGADIWLGPQFMTAYATSVGQDQGFLVTVIPWCMSLATTGFQFLVFQVTLKIAYKQASKSVKLAILVGWAVIFTDTATDIGGMMSLYKGPEVGLNILPSPIDLGSFVLIVATIILCGCNEFVVPDALRWSVATAQSSMAPGAFFVEWTVKIMNFAYNLFKGLTMFFSVVMILALDVFLSMYFFKTIFTQGRGNFSDTSVIVVSFLLSCGMTGVQILLYRMRRIQKKSGTKLSKRGQFQMALAFVLTGLDVLMDISGFTMLMYGPGQSGITVIPDNPSHAWMLMAITIFTLCGFYEPLVEVAFADPARSLKSAIPNLGGVPQRRPSQPQPPMQQPAYPQPQQQPMGFGGPGGPSGSPYSTPNPAGSMGFGAPSPAGPPFGQPGGGMPYPGAQPPAGNPGAGAPPPPPGPPPAGWSGGK